MFDCVELLKNKNAASPTDPQTPATGVYLSKASPDEACRYEALDGFRWDFVQLYIPLVVWHIQHMKIHKLNTQNIFFTADVRLSTWSHSVIFQFCV